MAILEKTFYILLIFAHSKHGIKDSALLSSAYCLGAQLPSFFNIGTMQILPGGYRHYSIPPHRLSALVLTPPPPPASCLMQGKSTITLGFCQHCLDCIAYFPEVSYFSLHNAFTAGVFGILLSLYSSASK
jgi:hypothetical protein